MIFLHIIGTNLPDSMQLPLSQQSHHLFQNHAVRHQLLDSFKFTGQQCSSMHHI